MADGKMPNANTNGEMMNSIYVGQITKSHVYVYAKFCGPSLQLSVRGKFVVQLYSFRKKLYITEEI